MTIRSILIVSLNGERTLNSVRFDPGKESTSPRSNNDRDGRRPSIKNGSNLGVFIDVLNVRNDSSVVG